MQKSGFCLLLQASINGFPMRFLSAFCFVCFCVLWGEFVAFHPKLTPNSPQESPHGQRQCRRLQRTDLHLFCRCRAQTEKVITQAAKARHGAILGKTAA